MVSNRDELLTRPCAHPPRWRNENGRSVAYPLDPQGGGTWIAVNQHGLAIALLNRRATRDMRRTAPASDGLPTFVRSRGEISIALAGSDSTRRALAILRAMDLASYPGFLLVVVAGGRMLVARSNGAEPAVHRQPLTTPIAFTSSSLSDAAAERLRLPLFRTLVLDSAEPLAGQRAFHDHQWPALPELSVRMQRPDARTVSRTTVNVTSGRVSMAYQAM